MASAFSVPGRAVTRRSNLRSTSWTWPAPVTMRRTADDQPGAGASLADAGESALPLAVAKSMMSSTASFSSVSFLDGSLVVTVHAFPVPSLVSQLHHAGATRVGPQHDHEPGT